MVIFRELQHLRCGDRANSRVESLPTLSLPPFSDVCLHELGKREHHLPSICNNKERKNKEKLLLSIINFITQESCLYSNRKPFESDKCRRIRSLAIWLKWICLIIINQFMRPHSIINLYNPQWLWKFVILVCIQTTNWSLRAGFTRLWA